VFTHPLKDGTVVTEESRCPHCSYSVQLAIVKQLGKMDTTTFPLATTVGRISESEYARKQILGAVDHQRSTSSPA
jgi:hypothetical protein